MHGRSRNAGRVVALVAAFVTTLALVNTAGAVQPPPGAAKPVAGSGIGTAAALANPKCAHDDANRYGVYGRLPSTFVGDGPVCVKPWKEGADNGGATAPGVTKDRIPVYAVMPNDQQLSMVGGATPQNRADNSRGTYQDAVHDYLLAAMKFYETYGRDIELRYFVSTGQDEAAQRADAVEVKAAKPFAVIDLAPDWPRRVRRRDGEGEDPRVRLRHHDAEGARAGAVPLGADRHPGRRPTTRPKCSASNSSARRRSSAATT